MSLMSDEVSETVHVVSLLHTAVASILKVTKVIASIKLQDSIQHGDTNPTLHSDRDFSSETCRHFVKLFLSLQNGDRKKNPEPPGV